MNEDHEEVARDAARAGETPHIARYILMISVVLLIIAFAAIMLFN